MIWKVIYIDIIHTPNLGLELPFSFGKGSKAILEGAPREQMKKTGDAIYIYINEWTGKTDAFPPFGLTFILSDFDAVFK